VRWPILWRGSRFRPRKDLVAITEKRVTTQKRFGQSQGEGRDEEKSTTISMKRVSMRQRYQWPLPCRGSWCEEKKNDHCFAEGLDATKKSMTIALQRALTWHRNQWPLLCRGSWCNHTEISDHSNGDGLYLDSTIPRRGSWGKEDLDLTNPKERVVVQKENTRIWPFLRRGLWGEEDLDLTNPKERVVIWKDNLQMIFMCWQHYVKAYHWWNLCKTFVVTKRLNPFLNDVTWWNAWMHGCMDKIHVKLLFLFLFLFYLFIYFFTKMLLFWNQLSTLSSNPRHVQVTSLILCSSKNSGDWWKIMVHIAKLWV